VCEPIWGYIYNTTVVQLTGSKFRCRIGHFAEPKIEPEIVLHFRTAPSLNADTDEILASIDWIAHGIEIVQSHFAGWNFKAADTIADQGLHATLIVGKPMEAKRLGAGVAADIEDFKVTLSCDGDVREQGMGSNALGSPLKAVEHLISVLAKQPHAPPLQSDEMVTTGTLTAAQPIHPGQSWSTNWKGIALSGISVSFEE
jgi:2-keto-4-pentenoate hydratase